MTNVAFFNRPIYFPMFQTFSEIPLKETVYHLKLQAVVPAARALTPFHATL